MEALRMMIVDDHAMVRRGLQTLMKGFDDIELVAEARNGYEAIELCATIQPDVVLMDIEMPLLDGITATRTIHRDQPEVRIIALVNFKDESKVKEIMDVGASAYLLKNASVDDVIATIRRVATMQHSAKI